MTIRISSISARSLHIPFAREFTHSARSRNCTETIWVMLTTHQGQVAWGEGCPRDYVTGETITSAMKFIHQIKKSVMHDVHSLDDLLVFVEDHKQLIDENPSAWCALEIAVLELLAQQYDVSVEKLLGIESHDNIFRYSAVLGSSSEDVFRRLVQQYQVMGFDNYKLKLSGKLHNDIDRIRYMESRLKIPELRVDANGLWDDAESAAQYLEKLPVIVNRVEEPLACDTPVSIDGLDCTDLKRSTPKTAEIKKLAGMLDMQIVLDESILTCDQIADYVDQKECFLFNVRVSKMGGLIRSLSFVEHARQAGFRMIVGAHVGETSLLTRVAMIVVKAAGSHCIAHEGGFGNYLLMQDPCFPVLQFGQNAKLDMPEQCVNGPGFGIRISA